jgi:BTB/POZ domain-containing protein KCTD9
VLISTIRARLTNETSLIVPASPSLLKPERECGWPMAARLDYDSSCARLRELGLLDRDSHPPMPERLPQCDDIAPLGVSMFRTLLDDDLDLSDLTLPRTFFGRSQIDRVSFRNSDLHESNMCWNDFNETDFTGADLAASDMRASLFHNVLFVATNLDGADLRQSSFTGCRFDGAAMKGTILERHQGATMHLSEAQRQTIDWRDERGPKPGGG